MDLVPTPVVGGALLACGLLPACLLGLSHGPCRIARPGLRFASASLLVVSSWVVGVCLAGGAAWADILTGSLLLLTCVLASFTLWTLLAWGFTLTMILAVSRREGPISFDEWAREYTRGRELEAFSRDRLGLLFRAGAATRESDSISLTPWRGRLLARAVMLFRRLYGLPS